MKYPYIVNKDGIWYPAGTEVPEGEDFIVDNKVIGKVKEDVIEITDKEVIENTLKDIEDNHYTKTEINRMSTAELQELAGEEGIAGASEMTGAELKKLLIEKFGL